MRQGMTHLVDPIPQMADDRELPIGYETTNAAGERCRWHGWGWAPALPEEVRIIGMIAHRDDVYRAKETYWPIARDLGASRIILASSNPDGSKTVACRIGDGPYPPVVTFEEKAGRVEVALTVRLDLGSYGGPAPDPDELRTALEREWQAASGEIRRLVCG